MKATLLILGGISLFFCSCERAVSFHLYEVPPKLVVEASIERGQPPIVYLSKSLNFFSRIDPATLANSFVHGAEVIVSNGVLTHRLKEYAVPVAGGFFIYYYYSIDSSSLATAFVGELMKNYSLRIVVDGNTYTSRTSIPDTTRRIDSIFWKPAPPGNEPEKVSVMIRIRDRPGFGDYIRYFTKRNGEPFYPGLNSVFDDQIIDGTSYEVQVERGMDRNADIPDDFSFFDKGDTVTFKLATIDKATFDFWRTMEFSYANIGNPFSSPTKVISNIEGGGLGYFGGYATQFRKIIIPR